MIQSFKDIYNQVSKITQFDVVNTQIQKVYSSSTLINFVCRKPGNTFSIFLGRGHGYEGLWLEEAKIESKLRKIDQLLEYLRKYLTSASIISFEMDDEDRIIYLNYFKNGRKNQFGFFYKARNLYFAHSYYLPEKSHYLLFNSWTKGVEVQECLGVSFESLGKRELSKEKTNKYKSVQEILKSEEKFVVKTINKKEEKLKRKIRFISEDLHKLKSFEKLRDFANEQADLSQLDKKIKINNIRINFKEKEHYKRRNELFEKSKALKSNIELMESRLTEAKKQFERIQQMSVGKGENSLQTIKPVFHQKSQKTPVNENKKVEYDIVDIDNLKFCVGKSSVGNDSMRKDWAKKEDIWFHLDGETGPHIIMKGTTIITDDVLKSVAKLMKKYLKSDKSELNLIYTAVKNLKGIKGVKGSVNFKKEKHIRVIL